MKNRSRGETKQIQQKQDATATIQKKNGTDMEMLILDALHSNTITVTDRNVFSPTVLRQKKKKKIS